MLSSCYIEYVAFFCNTCGGDQKEPAWKYSLYINNINMLNIVMVLARSVLIHQQNNKTLLATTV